MSFIELSLQQEKWGTEGVVACQQRLANWSRKILGDANRNIP